MLLYWRLHIYHLFCMAKSNNYLYSSLAKHWTSFFVFDSTLIAIGLVLDIGLCIKSWHGPKRHSLSSFSYCKEYLYIRNIFISMARPSGTQKVASTRQCRQENLASLSTEVLRLRLQVANLPITGRKAEMISRLKAAIQPCPSQPPSSRRVQKRTARNTKATGTRPRCADPTNAARVLGNASDKSSSVGAVDSFEDDEADLASLELSAPQRAPTDSQPGAFSDAQMAAIQDTGASDKQLLVSVHRTFLMSSSTYHIDSFPMVTRSSYSFVSPSSPGQESGGQNFAWWVRRLCLVAPDSLSRPQVPEIQLCVDDSTPGSTSPVSMVRKRKPVIDTFQKWLDAYTAYMLVFVTSYPQRSLELLKYQQIISRVATKFKGLAFLAFDEQFRRRAAYDLSISWDQVDWELWTVTFSGLAKPHCLLCSSPYHSQTDCPSADPSRPPPRTRLLPIQLDLRVYCKCLSVPPRLPPLPVHYPLHPQLPKQRHQEPPTTLQVHQLQRLQQEIK